MITSVAKTEIVMFIQPKKLLDNELMIGSLIRLTQLDI